MTMNRVYHNNTGYATTSNYYPYMITGMGGKLKIVASANVAGQLTSDSITCTVNGYTSAEEPTSNITAYLEQLYGPLLCGIADSESSYSSGIGQFKNQLPYTNPAGAVGLTQLYLPSHSNYDDFASYWDWQVNAQRGFSDFSQKLSTINALVAFARKGPYSKNLPDLGIGERENWALYRYKGFAGSDPLYLPNSNRTGWVVNTNAHLYTTARDQINAVRADARNITGSAGSPLLP